MNSKRRNNRMGLLKKIFKRKRGAANLKAIPTTNATGVLSLSSSNEAQSSITTGPGDDENESQLTQSAAPPLKNNKKVVIDATNLETLLSTLTDKDNKGKEEAGNHDDAEQELCHSSFSIESGMDSQSQESQSDDDASSSTTSTQISESAMNVLYRYITSCNKPPVSTFAMIDDMSSIASASISDDDTSTDHHMKSSDSIDGQRGHIESKHYTTTTTTTERVSNETNELVFSFLDIMCPGNTKAITQR